MALQTREACRRNNPPAPACCRSINRVADARERPGKQIKGRRCGGEQTRKRRTRRSARPEAATTNTSRTSGRPPSNPARARGLKMLALNSSILVAAPRWRRLLCLMSHLAPAHRQGVQLSGARHPAPSAFRLFVQAQKAATKKEPQGPQLLRRRRKARGSVQEMLRERILTRGDERQGLSVHRHRERGQHRHQ